MTAEELLKARAEALGSAVQSRSDNGNWSYVLNRGETPEEAAFAPVTGTFFPAVEGDVLWLRTAYTVPERAEDLPIAGERIYLTSNVFICAGTVWIDGEKVFDVPYWMDITRPDVTVAEKAEPGRTHTVCIRLTLPRLFTGDGFHYLAHIGCQAADDLAFSVAAFSEELRYAASLPGTQETLDGIRRELCTRIADCPASGLSALLASLRARFEPFRAAAKAHTVHLVAHSHIDIDWQWDREDTYNVARGNFATMTAIMDENPDFRFSQSQPALYHFVEERWPELFAKMQEATARGSWDCSNAARWVESDLNMVDGESLAHGLLYGKRYIREKFGKEPCVCHEPDTFGHPRTLPQFLRKAGVSYFFHMRGEASHIVHWFRAPDGSTLLAVADQHKGVLEIPRLINNALRYERECRLHDSLYMFGVGDHGGGPSRQDIARLARLNESPMMPCLQFSSLEDFFDAVHEQAASADIATLDGELGPVFEGCYTSHADMKDAHRRLENRLLQADAVNFLRVQAGLPADTAAVEALWKLLLEFQFHDTICGCSVHATYERDVPLAEEACAALDAYIDKALRELSGANGDPDRVAVWNLCPFERDEPVRLDRADVHPADADGKPLPCQLIDGGVWFIAEKLPPLSKREYRLLPGAPEAEPLPGTWDCAVETAAFSFRLHPQYGIIERMTDKRGGQKPVFERDFTAEARSGYTYNYDNGVLHLDYELPHPRSAWIIGPVARRETLLEAKPRLIARGAVADVVEVTRKGGHSTFVQRMWFYKSLPRVDFFTDADWQEQGTPDSAAPMLLFSLHPELTGQIRARFSVPGGVHEKAPDGLAHACLSWADVSDENYGFTLCNDNKYGCTVSGATLSMHCLRSSYQPDKIADIGSHRFAFALYPHAGDCRPDKAARQGRAFNSPVRLTPAGDAVPSGLCLHAEGAVIGGVKPGEDGGAVVRLYDVCGRGGRFLLTLAAPVKAAKEVDITERDAIGRPLTAAGNTVSGELAPYEIRTLHLTFAGQAEK